MEDIIQIYRALSEQMRLRILLLLTQGELCVCDIMAVLEEPQSKVSRHIAYLKNSGLIQGKRVGTWMHYNIKDNLDILSAAHVEFLKRQLSDLDWARADLKKMKEIREAKLCDEAATPVENKRPVQRSSKQCV